jgi:NAD(P)-dependent dehydrogenase (short-subunit alcohol dehydrogenase family)
MAYDFAGKRVLLTGASSGIGAALAERLASHGAVLGICARREQELAATLERVRAHSPSSQMWTCDMAVPLTVDALADGMLRAFGGVDVLVNNAGIPKRKHVTVLSPAIVEDVMRINYFGPIQLTLALLPSIIENKGRIVSVSSVAAPLSSPGEAAYDASKAALASFSEAMAVDLYHEGVKVMVVYPGVVDTPLFSIPDNDPLPEGTVEAIPVEVMIDAIVNGIHEDAAEVYCPPFFKDIAVGKMQNVAGFVQGAAEWLKMQKANSATPDPS